MILGHSAGTAACIAIEDDVSVQFCLATLYVKDRQPQRARDLLETITRLEPSNTDAENLLEDVNHMLAQSGTGEFYE